MPSSPRRSRPGRAATRTWRSSSRPPDSGNRTRGSTCSSRRWRGLPRQDVGERVDVHVLEHALAARLLEADDELRAEDVDLAVEDPPPVRAVLLLARQLVDEGLQVGVGEAGEVGKRLQRTCPFGRRLKRESPTLKLRLRF